MLSEKGIGNTQFVRQVIEKNWFGRDVCDTES